MAFKNPIANILVIGSPVLNVAPGIIGSAVGQFGFPELDFYSGSASPQETAPAALYNSGNTFTITGPGQNNLGSPAISLTNTGVAHLGAQVFLSGDSIGIGNQDVGGGGVQRSGFVPNIWQQNINGTTNAVKLLWQIVEATISVPVGNPGVSAAQNYPVAFPNGFAYIIAFVNLRNQGTSSFFSPSVTPQSGSQYVVSCVNTTAAAVLGVFDLLFMAGYAT